MYIDFIFIFLLIPRDITSSEEFNSQQIEAACWVGFKCGAFFCTDMTDKPLKPHDNHFTVLAWLKCLSHTQTHAHTEAKILPCSLQNKREISPADVALMTQSPFSLFFLSAPTDGYCSNSHTPVYGPKNNIKCMLVNSCWNGRVKHQHVTTRQIMKHILMWRTGSR